MRMIIRFRECILDKFLFARTHNFDIQYPKGYRHDRQNACRRSVLSRRAHAQPHRRQVEGAHSLEPARRHDALLGAEKGRARRHAQDAHAAASRTRGGRPRLAHRLARRSASGRLRAHAHGREHQTHSHGHVPLGRRLSGEKEPEVLLLDEAARRRIGAPGKKKARLQTMLRRALIVQRFNARIRRPEPRHPCIRFR